MRFSNIAGHDKDRIHHEGLFVNDNEVINIVFEEGIKTLRKIGQGNISDGNIDYINSVIEAVGHLNIDRASLVVDA